MSKTLDTLVEDIHEVVETRGGWDETVTKFISEGVHDVFKSHLEDDAQERVGALRMSSMGRPCKRQLWYQNNTPSSGEGLPPKTLIKFLYGGMVELLLLSLAKAAGHDVAGMQDTLSIKGIKGHRDAVIDGVTVDIKSASPFSFKKFKEGLSPDSDGFGYLGQLEAYVKAGHRDTPRLVHPTTGAFIVLDKVSGEICVDKHEFTRTLEEVEAEYESTIGLSEAETPPERGIKTIPDGYKHKEKGFVPNGNEYLDFNCAYCEFKHECWPNLRTFMYRNGPGYAPRFFSKIVKEPKAQEVI